MYRYDRRGDTVYRIEADGHISVMFHIANPTTNQSENADQVVLDANMHLVEQCVIRQ